MRLRKIKAILLLFLFFISFVAIFVFRKNCNNCLQGFFCFSSANTGFFKESRGVVARSLQLAEKFFLTSFLFRSN
ncbi:MAG: hypothetical protein UW09_C0004G0023 [candidate division TM6 bacterium GW2011_GWF2_43_87]|nr:MAG: hypothetical protein UW09_C0004G0023 [candidate division TM6 bacterium GW2011_GWF2_43_87]